MYRACIGPLTSRAQAEKIGQSRLRSRSTLDQADAVFHLTLEQGHSLLTMLAVPLSAVILAGIFYRRAFAQLLPSRRRQLLALRTAAIVLVVLLLFRPVLFLERDVVERRSVILAVDTSASMSTADDATGTSRFDQAKARVLDWSARLKKDFDLHVLEFSERATPLDRPGDLSQLKADGQATSLDPGAGSRGASRPRREVEAVVLFSDGIHNAAGDPVTTARKLGVVVHAVGVGNSLRNSPSHRDVRVADLECPEQLPVNNRARIKAHVGQSGLAGQVVKAVLEDDGKPLDQAELVLREGDGLQEVVFQFVPTAKGRHTYTVRIPPVSEEKIAQNNHRSAVVQVVDSKIRVLYLEGTLRAEYGALVQRFLSKDPDLEFCALVQTRPNVFVERANMEGIKLNGLPSDAATLEKFDVVLLGDLDSTYWKPQSMELLIRRVRDGAGLLAFGGYHSLGPGGYGGTPLEGILPVLRGRQEHRPDHRSVPAGPHSRGPRSPDLRQHRQVLPDSDRAAQVAGLPPLDGCVRVKGARPGALVLATHPAGDAKMPVLAVQPAGKGRVAVFTSDTTRNWQQVPRALDQESPFARFWGQMIRWLANRTEDVKAEAKITARTDKAYYEPDSSITISAAVRDKEGEGTDQAEVVAKVKGPQAATDSVTLAPVAGSAGSYQGSFEPKSPGTYEIVVEAHLGRDRR